MTESHQNVLTGHFGSAEPNVIIAGLEGAAVIWFIVSDRSATIPAAGQWNWFFVVYGVLALLAVLLIGFMIEGLAGLLEHATTRKLWGPKKGNLWSWYITATKPPDNWGPAQRWMWSSPQASQEFARRRMRILTTRNTAFVLLTTTAFTVVSGRTVLGARLIDFIVGLVLTALFVWLWLSAHHGWNKAVRDAGDLGKP